MSETAEPKYAIYRDRNAVARGIALHLKTKALLAVLRHEVVAAWQRVRKDCRI
jgi:hypothetical protein